MSEGKNEDTAYENPPKLLVVLGGKQTQNKGETWRRRKPKKQITMNIRKGWGNWPLFGAIRDLGLESRLL